MGAPSPDSQIARRILDSIAASATPKQPEVEAESIRDALSARAFAQGFRARIDGTRGSRDHLCRVVNWDTFQVQK
jgi:hypothetical protein